MPIKKIQAWLKPQKNNLLFYVNKFVENKLADFFADNKKLSKLHFQLSVKLKSFYPPSDTGKF